jgi:flagellar basal body-associated protein FliL
MSESSEEAAIPAPQKSGKLMTILALVNFLAVLGLGGYFVYTQQHAAAQSKSEAKADPHAAKPAEHGDAKEEGEHGEAKEEGEHGEAKEDAAHGAGDDKGHEDAEGEKHGSGPLLPLESMVTNLADPDSNRYLKVTIQLRITSESAKAEVEAHLVPVRSQILLYLSSLTIEDLSGADNKRAIQKRVKRIANDAMPSSRVTQVYFTEFVIQ